MTTTKDEVKTLLLFQKLLKLQSMNVSVDKNGKNSFFKNAEWKPSSYVVLDDIMIAYKKPLSDCGLYVYNFIRTDEDNNYVVTKIVDCDDDSKFIENIFPIAKTWTPQAMWSAISYWKRYNIGALLCIATEVDADWNEAPEIKKPEVKSKLEDWLTEKYFDKIENSKNIEELKAIRIAIDKDCIDKKISESDKQLLSAAKDIRKEQFAK